MACHVEYTEQILDFALEKGGFCKVNCRQRAFADHGNHTCNDRVFNHTADPEAYQCNDDKESKERASGSFREEVCDTALHVAQEQDHKADNGCDDLALGDGGNEHTDRNIGCSQQEIAKDRSVGYSVGNCSVGSKKQRIQAHNQHWNHINGEKCQIFSKDNIGNFYRCGKEQLIRLIFLLLRQDTHCQNRYCDQQNKCGILQRVSDLRVTLLQVDGRKIQAEQRQSKRHKQISDHACQIAF